MAVSLNWQDTDRQTGGCRFESCYPYSMINGPEIGSRGRFTYLSRGQPRSRQPYEAALRDASMTFWASSAGTSS